MSDGSVGRALMYRLVGLGFDPSSCYFVSSDKTFNSHCLGIKSFTNNITSFNSNICGLEPDLLFRVGFLKGLQFSLITLRQMVMGLEIA